MNVLANVLWTLEIHNKSQTCPNWVGQSALESPERAWCYSTINTNNVPLQRWPKLPGPNWPQQWVLKEGLMHSQREPTKTPCSTPPAVSIAWQAPQCAWQLSCEGVWLRKWRPTLWVHASKQPCVRILSQLMHAMQVNKSSIKQTKATTL